MKKKILSFILAFACIITCTCGLCLTACTRGGTWEHPKRIALSLPDNLHVEYTNHWLKGDSLLPSYCILVKEGNFYYVKTPHKYYYYDRLEVYVKTDLKNAVEFAGPDYAQSLISARWSDYTNSWISAADDSETAPNAPEWHANDKNGSVYYTGIGFLDSGYGDVNHPYDNGVTSSQGYTHTATQKENQTLTLESGQQVECVVWEYSFTTSDEDTWSKEKFWFEANTGITIQRSSITSSSENQSLDADENIGLKATYFATDETMQSYLSQDGVDRWPAPDFSIYS